MTDGSRAAIRASLEEERQSLVQRLAELGEGPAADASLAFDQNFADTSHATAERAEVEALVGSLRESLADVENALEKFDKGTFGLCERCGTEIPSARLEAKPEARFCIEHAGHPMVGRRRAP